MSPNNVVLCPVELTLLINTWAQTALKRFLIKKVRFVLAESWSLRNQKIQPAYENLDFQPSVDKSQTHEEVFYSQTMEAPALLQDHSNKMAHDGKQDKNNFKQQPQYFCFSPKESLFVQSPLAFCLWGWIQSKKYICLKDK